MPPFPILTDELLASLRAESQRAFEIRCEFKETVAKTRSLILDARELIARADAVLKIRGRSLRLAGLFYPIFIATGLSSS